MDNNIKKIIFNLNNQDEKNDIFSKLNEIQQIVKPYKINDSIANREYSKDDYENAYISIVEFLNKIIIRNDDELGSYQLKLNTLLQRIRKINIDYTTVDQIKELYERLNNIRDIVRNSNYYQNSEENEYKLHEDDENDNNLLQQLDLLEYVINNIQEEISQKAIAEKKDVEEEVREEKEKVEELVTEKIEHKFYKPIDDACGDYRNNGWFFIFLGMMVILIGSYNGNICEIMNWKTFKEQFEHRFFFMFWAFGILFIYQGLIRLNMSHQLKDFSLRGRSIEDRDALLNPENSQDVKKYFIKYLVENRIFEIKKDKISYKQAIKIIKDIKEISKD